MATLTLTDGKIEIYKGDDRDIQFTVQDMDGNAKDITGADLWFTVKKNITDNTAKIYLTTGDGMTISASDSAVGVFTVNISTTDTEDLKAGEYVWEAKMKLNNRVTTLHQDKFEILNRVS